ncbi:hypothetical protein AAG906_040764 [Vitis piasezkii]
MSIKVLQQHEDALILILGVDGFDVQIILVDPANLGRLLFGFNEATITFLGDVVLSIQADLVTLSMQFSMVDDLSSYNAIIGRAWLHKMKVISSTYHQMCRPISAYTRQGVETHLYVSKTMVDAETRYSQVGKTALALKSVARKLRPYFQVHQVTSPTRELIEQAIHISFSTSNNEAEYEVVLAGLDLALMLAATKLEIRSDSWLIDECMTRYLAMAEEHLKKLNEWIITWVPQ